MFENIIYYIINTMWKLDKSKGKRTDANSSFYFIKKNQILGRYNFAKKFVKNKRVLDIACGEGIGSFLLSKDAKEVLGVDNDKVLINTNTKKYIRKNLSFCIDNAENLKMKRKFDVVVSFETIEHLYNPEKFIITLKNILNKKGLLILSTPNREIKEIYFNGRLADPDHKREFYINEMKNLLAKNGFVNIKVYYYHILNKKIGFLSLPYYFIKNRFRVIKKPKNKNIIPIMFMLCAEKK